MGHFSVETCAPPGSTLSANQQQGFSVSKLGVRPAQVQYGSEAVSFVEITGSGTIRAMTIKFDDGAAIFSRTTITDGKFAATQEQGTCEKQ